MNFFNCPLITGIKLLITGKRRDAKQGPGLGSEFGSGTLDQDEIQPETMQAENKVQIFWKGLLLKL